MHAIQITKPGTKLSLDDTPTGPRKRIDHDEMDREMEPLDEELFELQDLMWGARTHSVLVVLQGRDTAGKDGTVKRVVGALNPRGVHVVSFGVPTQEELEHDFLWRVHRHAPRKGEFAIFNRSHYEDVLVTRVHGLIDKATWRARYGHIQDFETLLADHGCIVLKFFLHISKREQRERLIAREQDTTKAWKLDPTDWKERRHLDDYTAAYESAFKHCTSKKAPWYIVPADSKSYRNLCVEQAIVEALRPYAKGWRATLAARGKERLRELHKLKYRK
jgi:PPK2 family polyphosphate:nucleotide phosphotransferase